MRTIDLELVAARGEANRSERASLHQLQWLENQLADLRKTLEPGGAIHSGVGESLASTATQLSVQLERLRAARERVEMLERLDTDAQA